MLVDFDLFALFMNAKKKQTTEPMKSSDSMVELIGFVVSYVWSYVPDTPCMTDRHIYIYIFTLTP